MLRWKADTVRFPTLKSALKTDYYSGCCDCESDYAIHFHLKHSAAAGGRGGRQGTLETEDRYLLLADGVEVLGRKFVVLGRKLVVNARMLTQQGVGATSAEQGSPA